MWLTCSEFEDLTTSPSFPVLTVIRARDNLYRISRRRYSCSVVRIYNIYTQTIRNIIYACTRRTLRCVRFVVKTQYRFLWHDDSTFIEFWSSRRTSICRRVCLRYIILYSYEYGDVTIFWITNHKTINSITRQPIPAARFVK